MRSKSRYLWCSVAVVIAAFSFAPPLQAADSDLPLQTVADIPLTGRTTRFDYESIDQLTHRLYIAHLGDSTVTVFDTAKEEVIADISQVGHVHGVIAIPEIGRVYASATQTNEVVAIDEKTFQIVARVPGGIYPDGMAYAPQVHRLYVSDKVGTTVSVIDTETQKRINTIPLWSAEGSRSGGACQCKLSARANSPVDCISGDGPPVDGHGPCPRDSV